MGERRADQAHERTGMTELSEGDVGSDCDGLPLDSRLDDSQDVHARGNGCASGVRLPAETVDGHDLTVPGDEETFVFTLRAVYDNCE